MHSQDTPPLDFDRWAELARRDPQAFEVQRARLIETAIGQAPARMQPRLRCLQWKIDRIRDTAATPMAACLRINQLLWDSLAGNGGLLEQLQRLRAPAHPPAGRHRAKILPFTG
ncbi:MAG: DUF3135 domain-containing protein [Gammaproteobacteria bacterium]